MGEYIQGQMCTFQVALNDKIENPNEVFLLLSNVFKGASLARKAGVRYKLYEYLGDNFEALKLCQLKNALARWAMEHNVQFEVRNFEDYHIGMTPGIDMKFIISPPSL